ncbi:MAG TPA: flagellar hook capping FlgD N-terminal domain-containing protein [Anaerolineaceae bacterium]
MAVNPVSSATNGIDLTALNQKSTSATQKTDMDNFMTILMAQLKNQNPLEPMQDKDFMAQMAQFNSLNELRTIKTTLAEMTKSYQNSYATSLLGKQVRATRDNVVIEGVITSVSTENGTPVVYINNQRVALSSIIEVSGAAK